MNVKLNESSDQLQVKERLTQILDYVAHQASDGKKIQYEVPTPYFPISAFKGLKGVTEINDGQWWFKIERLELPEMVELPEEYRPFFTMDEEAISIKMNYEMVKQKIQFKWLDEKNPEFLKPYLPKFMPVDQVLVFFSSARSAAKFMDTWLSVVPKMNAVRQSIKLYDQFFAWQSNIALGGSVDSNEAVAGFGMVNWNLPSGKKYSYPLVTIPLEMDIDDHGAIYVGPKDVRPQVEMDAILGEDDIQNSAIVRDNLKTTSNDGRFLDIFDAESYGDLARYFVASIDSRGKVSQSLNIGEFDEGALVVPEVILFTRPRTSNVLHDDIDALKSSLNDDDTVVPEQPCSLVTELSDERKDRSGVLYRGRSGSQGEGVIVRDLYFPLPYNGEQVTIVKNLDTDSGVVVQGPPGTGKTHTIANIICHYLALGKKILVTAQQPHVLKTLHEKIPEELRHLVISRIGNSQESKRQLEANIDHIIQNLSQLNEFDVQREIDGLVIAIDRTHSDMADADREIFNFAQHHYKDIAIGETKRTPIALAQYVLDGKGLYDWFPDSDISIEVQGDFPLSKSAMTALIQARKDLGASLHHFKDGEIPDPALLLSPSEIRSLQSDMVTIRDYKNEVAKLDYEVDKKADVEALKALESQLKQYQNELCRIYEISHYDNSMVAQLIVKPTMEFEVFNDFIKENAGLLEYRKELLVNPLTINMSIPLHETVIKAIERGAKGGKPFSWYHSKPSGSALEQFQSITVSGHAPQSQAEWQVIQNYLDKDKQMVSFVARWNKLAETIGLIPLPDMGSLETKLRIAQGIIDWLQSFKDVYQHRGVGVKREAEALFSKQPNVSFAWLDDITKLLKFIEGNNRVRELDQAIDKLHKQKAFLQENKFYKSDFLLEQINKLEKGDLSDVVVNNCITTTNYIASLFKLKGSYRMVLEANQAFVNAGAFNLAHAILNEACDDLLEDPVIKPDMVEAWNWKRASDYINAISNTNELEALIQKRKNLEKLLSANYEKIAAKKTWLALKQNASEKTLVALNRYKIAVQKIGKGTGKNAPRYRKDAQEALMQVSQSIPCWIMSHYQVSETMPAEVGMFDLVIVDEASQSSIDAIPVLLRAKKLLVVGDNKQVSPSNVGLSAEQINVLRNKYLFGQPHKEFLTPDMSLYDMASSIYESSVMLLEHFRCHPEIISYSNKNFYAGRIKPMRISKKSEQLSPALVPIYVEDGARESKSNKHINRKEAEAIIAEMRNVFEDPKCQGKSLGCISLLGSAQAEYIQSLALDTFGVEALTKVKFACGEASSFQGAERDIIFLSMVADPMNCSPLSSTAHEQRLNVAASRARERMYLVSSVKSEHLSSKDLRVALLAHFYDKPQIEEYENSVKIELCESEFEKDVFTALVNKGYKVTPQVKVGSYRIDMVVESTGDSRLAVECDGDSFHGPDVWTQDMIRQRDLERAGWSFWRCFASSWYMDTEKMIESLESTLHKMGIYPAQEEVIEYVE